ncbi:iron-sulfur cluster assembly accessory protein [Natronoflexus pectinivorans]|uniref:Fe-S cluster assembly iron-binding protein IscA n=1 Tax=Natronoflexus pectinivorans TaxID=682526 RepID=A0A4R2GII5_9BACT|nr:hypothetical protein [Natronoflexus pectinivorans]TCO08389.1 Fe-S cluster assembly iron-binding protein IscA [Natronoflexus pectinivorans]
MELTPNAIHKIKEMLEGKKSEVAFIRVAVEENKNNPGIRFTVESRKKVNDKIISIEGIPLVMDMETERTLSGYIINYKLNGFTVDFMLPGGRCCR